MGNEWGEQKSDGSVCLPPRLLPRMDVLTPDGIYIAFNGSFLYVWLGKSCDVNCVNELFGFSSVDQADGACCRCASSTLMCLTSGCRRRCPRPGVRFGAFAFT